MINQLLEENKIEMPIKRQRTLWQNQNFEEKEQEVQTEIQKLQKEIFDFFPAYTLEPLSFRETIFKNLEEIRVRIGQAILLKSCEQEIFLRYRLNMQDMVKILENFAHNSVYSFQNEINAGFLTLKGGHRVGLAGTCVIENNEIKNLKQISSFNIRVAREKIDCSVPILDKILNGQGFQNTLLLSPPRLW